jgi:hypothetical protein
MPPASNNQFLTTDFATQIISGIATQFQDNIGVILVVLGFTVGISIVMSLLGLAKDGRALSGEASKWNGIMMYRNDNPQRVDDGEERQQRRVDY